MASLAAVLPPLILESLIRPRRGLRQFLLLQLPPIAVFWAICLYSVLVVFMSYFNLFSIPTPDESGTTTAPEHVPFIPALGYFGDLALGVGSLYVTAGACFALGRFFGGIASFQQAVQMTLWFNIVQLPVFLAMRVDIAILLALTERTGGFAGALTAITSAGLFAAGIWIIVVYCKFIAELHQFKNAFKVFGVILAVFTAIFLLFFTLFGVVPVPVGA